MMRKLQKRFCGLCLAALLLNAPAVCLAFEDPWEGKAPEQWDQKAVAKVLEASPWVRTGLRMRDPQASSLVFQVRFDSALPVRLALQRQKQLGAGQEAKDPGGLTGSDAILVRVRVWCCGDPEPVFPRTLNDLRAQALQLLPFDLGRPPLRARLVLADRPELEGDPVQVIENSRESFEAIFAFPRPRPDRFADFKKQTLHFQLGLPGYPIQAEFKLKDMTYRDRLEL